MATTNHTDVDQHRLLDAVQLIGQKRRFIDHVQLGEGFKYPLVKQGEVLAVIGLLIDSGSQIVMMLEKDDADLVELSASELRRKTIVNH